ncbi:MAG TPA: sulfurtransferase TusA family protein [Gammaproteobacteria bacterium]|nr:sulfurtransferase TusA family protein [Gammaproteobacteria bacterium]
MNIAQEVDARGMNCPLPILKVRKAIATVGDGDVIKLIATDPGSVKDMQAFCAQTGNELVESGEEDGAYVFLVRRLN